MNTGNILSFGQNQLKNGSYYTSKQELQNEDITQIKDINSNKKIQENIQNNENNSRRKIEVAKDLTQSPQPSVSSSQRNIADANQNPLRQKKLPFNEHKQPNRMNFKISELSNTANTPTTKSQKIEALRQKIGISKQKSIAIGNDKQKKKDGILKIGIKKLSDWMSDKWNNCCRRKGKISKQIESTNSAINQKGITRDQNKRRTGLSGKNRSNGDDCYSSGEEQGTSTKDGSAYLKKDAVKQNMKYKRNSTVNSDQEKIEKELKLLRDVVKQMSKQKMLEKAFRHLMDGLLYRTVRHDLDKEQTLSPFILFIWKVQNSMLWNDFLLFLGWVYIFMSFFEPSSRNEKSLDHDSFIAMVCIESIILILQTIDLIMEIIQRSTQEGQNMFRSLLNRKKNFFRLLFFLLNTSDLIYYATSYPVNTFRFARVFRPLQIIIFSKSLRRNFQGIINSAKNLIMILFFDIIITFFWAYIGVNMIGDLYSDPRVDTFAVDFRDFLKSANALYIFSTLDAYPDIMFPSITNSSYYLLYFLPYLIMFLLLFAPIPVAVVYEGFRKHRLNLLLADRIKRRKALWACFQCIVSDSKKSYIGRSDFILFFNFVYKKMELDDTAEILSDILWSELDINDNKKVSIEEFFTVIDFTEQRKEFRLQRIKPFLWWIRFREYVQNKFNLIGILQGSRFEMISLLVTLGSCTFTVLALFQDEDSSMYIVTDNIDKGFFAFFVLEILLKIIAYGPNAFFDESWNVFDLVLVLFQAFFDFIFYSFMKTSNVKSFSASRVLKIAKLQKVFRMFRAFRTVKILNYILSGLDIIKKVYEMLYKIVICIPIVMKLSVICVIVFYIYAAVGVEIFSSTLRKQHASGYGQQMCDNPQGNLDDYTHCSYADFNTFGGAILVLLQVCVGSGWGNIQFDFGKRFNDMTVSAIYFNSFHFLAVFVLSLIGGLVWEVFDVVERIMRDQQAYEQQMELQRQWEEQQQQIEASFQSSDQVKKSGYLEKNTQVKRGSVRQSLKNVASLMKLPMLAQKFNLKGPHQQTVMEDHHDDEDSDNYEETPKNEGQGGEEVQFQNNQQISKASTNKNNQMEDNNNKRNSINLNSEEEYNSSDYETGSSSEEEDDEEEELDEEQENNEDYQIADEGQDEDFDKIINQNSQKSAKNEQSDRIFNTKDQTEDIPELAKQKSLFNTKSDVISHVSDQDSLMNASKGVNLIDKKNQLSLQFKGQKPSISNLQQKLKRISQEAISKQSDQQDQKPLKVQTKKQSNLFMRKRRKKKLDNDLALIYRQKCFIDNQPITQRDRSQLILYQDTFKLSTLDQFFRNSQFKPQLPSIHNDALEKIQKFHTIKEEEEEELDNNVNSPFSKNKQVHVLSQRMSFNPSEYEAEKKQNFFQEYASQYGMKKQYSSQNDLQGIIGEEELDEDDSVQTKMKFPPRQYIEDTHILSKLRQSQSADKDQNRNKYQQIRNSPIMNKNNLAKAQTLFITPQTSDQQYEKNIQPNNHSKRSSEESKHSVRLLKLPTDLSVTSKEQEQSLQTLPRNNSLQSNNIYNINKQQSKISNDSFDLFKQRYSVQGQQNSNVENIKKQFSQSHSRFSSVGGLIIPDATQNTLSQNHCSEQPSSSSSCDSPITKNQKPSNIKIESKQKLDESQKNKDSLKQLDFFEYVEQQDSPQSKYNLPQIKYNPSMQNRSKSQDLLNEVIQLEQIELQNISSNKMSNKILDQNQKKSIFGQSDEGKSNLYTTTSLSNNDLKYMNQNILETSQKQINSNTSQDQKIIQATKKKLASLSSTNNQNNSSNNLDKKINSNNLDVGQNSYSNFSTHYKDTHSKSQITDDDAYQQQNRKISTIPEQSSRYEQDQMYPSQQIGNSHSNYNSNNNINHDSNNNNKNKNEYKPKLSIEDNSNQNTIRTRNSIIGTHMDRSDCMFVNNTNEDQHNIPDYQPINTLKSQISKDLKYDNFKKEIDEQNNNDLILQDDDDDDNNDEDQQMEQEQLEQSFLQEMDNLQNEVFEEETKIKKKQKKQKKNQALQQLREQHKIELMNYYKSNLVDVNFLIDYQQHNFGSYTASQKQPQQIESKAQRDMIFDKPKNGQMKNFLMNINQNLRNEQQIQIKIDLNNKNYIINKAILKSVDQEKIQKIELRHFRQLYGKQFEDMLDNDIFPLWSQQAKMLFHFDNILKFDYIPVEQFIQIYSSLELQISSLLMNKFSSFKILFQDNDDKWFTVNYVQESFFLQEVEKNGPWQFYDSLFADSKKNIYKHRNIFNCSEDKQNIKKKLKKFFQVSQDISNNFNFRKLQINQKRSDVIYIPFVNDNIDQQQKSVLDIIQNTPNLPEYVKKEDLNLSMIPRIKKGLAIAYLFDNPNVRERKRQQFMSEHINIEQAMVEEDMIAQQQLNSTLNYTYSIELLKDVKNHIYMNKENLFKKISQFYFYRSCLERNFCSITEIHLEQQ